MPTSTPASAAPGESTPVNLTVDATAATTIDTTLNLGTNVTLQTTASGASGPGVVTPSGAGDIIVASSLAWSSGAALTLSAYHDVTVNSGVTIKATGKDAGLTLQADNTGAGAGTVTFAGAGVQASLTKGSVQIFYNPASYATPTNYVAKVSAKSLTAYMLVNSLANLQAISSNLGGTYALGRDIDASGSATMNCVASVCAGFAPLGTLANAFSGLFNGQGHVIGGLVINRPSTAFVGLFGHIGGKGVVENVGLIGGSVTGSHHVGDLAGRNDGVILQSYATGTVTGSSGVGGLAGVNTGSISQSYASSAVNGPAGATFIGGLVGENLGGRVSQSYATGAVTGGPGASFIGGLVGFNFAGVIQETYATGPVSGGLLVGGLVGSNFVGSVTKSYWDKTTTHQNTSAGGTGLTTAQFTKPNLSGSPGALRRARPDG